MADPDVQIWGVGAVIQTLRKREGPSLKEKIWTLRALVWSKNKAGVQGPSSGSATEIAFRDLHNSSYPTKAEFNNCFIIHSK